MMVILRQLRRDVVGAPMSSVPAILVVEYSQVTLQNIRCSSLYPSCVASFQRLDRHHNNHLTIRPNHYKSPRHRGRDHQSTTRRA